MGDLLSSSTVNVHRRPDNVPVVINERKVHLLNVLHTCKKRYCLAVILHKQNIAHVSCRTGAIINDLRVIPKLSHWL